MLKEVMKYFKPAQADSQEEVTSMTTEKDQALLATDITTTTAELTAQLSTVTESLTTLQASFAELQTQLEAAQAVSAALEADKAALVAEDATKVAATRLTKLEAVLGTEKAPVMLASLSGLDEASFETVLSGMAATYEAEAKSEMFQEKGVAAEAAPVVEADVAQRLAASFAAQFKS